jgi:hypothetical protein
MPVRLRLLLLGKEDLRTLRLAGREVEVKPAPSSSLSIKSAERLYVIEEFPMKRIIGSFAAMLIFLCRRWLGSSPEAGHGGGGLQHEECMFTCNTLDDE